MEFSRAVWEQAMKMRNVIPGAMSAAIRWPRAVELIASHARTILPCRWTSGRLWSSTDEFAALLSS